MTPEFSVRAFPEDSAAGHTGRPLHVPGPSAGVASPAPPVYGKELTAACLRGENPADTRNFFPAAHAGARRLRGPERHPSIMNKFLKACIAIVVLAAIVCSGWYFFRSSMSAHPLVRECYAALVRHDPDSEGYLMKIACFAIDEKDGARLLLICEQPAAKGTPQKLEAVFPIVVDPAAPKQEAGGSPFENPNLVITSFTVKRNGETKTFTADPPLHGVPTPSGMHRPIGTVTGFKDGRPVGPKSLTSYNRSYHFFRYDDVAEEEQK